MKNGDFPVRYVSLPEGRSQIMKHRDYSITVTRHLPVHRQTPNLRGPFGEFPTTLVSSPGKILQNSDLPMKDC